MPAVARRRGGLFITQLFLLYAHPEQRNGCFVYGLFLFVAALCIVLTPVIIGFTLIVPTLVLWRAIRLNRKITSYRRTLKNAIDLT